MQLDEGTTADVLARLRRIQGQVGGIIRMIEAGRVRGQGLMSFLVRAHMSVAGQA